MQDCPLCGKPRPENPRYPRALCEDCHLLAADEEGRGLTFSNADMGGGFVATVTGTGEIRDSHTCFVRGVRCRADEARFGGIVIQVVPSGDGSG